jgi:hypothetical protein
VSLDFQQAAARRMRRLIIALAGLVVVLAGTVLVLALRSGGATPVTTSSPATTTAAQPTSSAQAVTPAITPGAGFVAPVRWVRLPRPAGTRLGLPTGFEHTPQGAVAAAVAIAQCDTWDLDLADRAAQAYSLPGDQDKVRASSRQSVTASRQENGLPGTGPLPAGASLSSAPIGVAWTAVSADRVEVSMLSRTTYTTPAAGQKTMLFSSHERMVWSNGDWYGVPYAPDTTTKLLPVADLGSAAFNDAGWTAIQQGSAG